MQDSIKKLKFRDSGVVLNAPASLEEAFKKLGFKTNFDKKTKSSNTLVFINDNKSYLHFLTTGLKHIEPDSVLWFAYPKGSSKIKTDINRDTIRVTGEQFGITTVTAISIDETWTALRFRPIEKVGQ
ncbi:MAG: hypothetical protein ABIU63_16710 [Chitinophagaceae bacterium]